MSSTLRPLPIRPGDALARLFTRERLLLVLFVTYLIACMLVLLFLRQSAIENIEQAALARAQSEAAALMRDGAASNDPRRVAHAARWLAPGSPADEFERRAISLASQPAGSSLHELHMLTSPAFLDLAVADGRGGVFLLRQPIDSELQAQSVPFEQNYVRIAVGGALLITAFALIAARSQRRAFAAGLGQREAEASRREIDQDRIRLLWVLGLSAVIFMIDLYVPLGPAVGIAYVTVVVMAQFAHNPVQVWFAAVLGMLLTVAKLVLSERIPDMWPALANRTLSIFALWTVAVLGQWQKRTYRRQTRAELQAQETLNANLTLQRALDRTEEAEAQLRRGQQLLDTVATMARIGGWEYDVATVRLSWSKEVYRIHGLEPGPQPSLERALQFFPRESRDLLVTAFKAAIEHGAPYDLTVQLINARDECRWVRTLGTAEQSGGVTVRITGAFQDVTEQYEAQARLDRAVRGTQDGIWEQDVTTKQVWLSPRFRKLVGYNAEELPNGVDVFAQLLHPDDLEPFETCLRAHLDEGCLFDLEFRLRLRNGEYHWFRARASSTAEAVTGHTTLSGSIRDTTAEREAGAALRAATTAAAEASRAKGEFLANMSHEIRTPMNGVLGMTELLLDTSLDATQRQFAQTIRSSATALLTILNDILDFSKIEAGKLTIERVPIDPRQCVKEVGAMMTVQAAAKGLRFIVDVDPSVPTYVMGDAHRLRQILVNLCGNAIKFTRSGHVTVEVFASATQAGRTLLSFEVRDTGIGMEPETITRLFQPFTQADASTTRHFGGTGLGLSIVRRLVELMDGRIAVSSAPGIGSSFTFTLPLESSGATSTEPPAPFLKDTPETRAEAFAGATVLVVEDNEVNREVARRFLERLGCTTVVVTDGRAALEACAQRNFDLILMDVQMPVMDGLTATRELRRLQTGSHRTPIVALTASAMTGELDRCLEAGMDGLLTKPLEVARLRDVLSRYITPAAADTPVSEPVFEVAAETGAVSGDDPPVDLSRLRALIGEDDEFVRDLCHTFMTTADEILKQLDQALASGNRTAFASAAHKLKGGSQSICAERVARLAQALERGAPGLSLPELAACLEELREAIAHCARYLPQAIH